MPNDLAASQGFHIEAACMRLMALYCHGLDAFDDESILALFVHDGAWLRPGHLRPQDPTIEGRDAIGHYLAGRERSLFMRHIVTNAVVDVLDPAHATGLSYWTVYKAENHVAGTVAILTGPFAIGEYRDQYRLENGQWRIVSRTTSYAFRAP